MPVAASCSQTDLTFVENPLSSQVPHQLPMLPPRTQQQQEEEVYSRMQLSVTPTVQGSAAGSTSDRRHRRHRRHRMTPLQQEIPLFLQLKERVCLEVASLVSENQTRPFYVLQLVRAAMLLNTDYLRQAGLDSLKLVMTNFRNTDRQQVEAFSSLVSTEQEFPAGEGTAAEEGVYSPTQNFPLARHYLGTNISGSSGNAAAESCDSRGYYLLSDSAGHQWDYIGVFPWEQLMRVLGTRLIPLRKEYLDRTCEPRLLELIYRKAICLLSELFPKKVALRVQGMLDGDLKKVLSRYTSQLLRDCRDKLLLDVTNLFFSQLEPLILSLSRSLRLSFAREVAEAGGSEREGRDLERDDALVTALLKSPPVQREQDEANVKAGDDIPSSPTLSVPSSPASPLLPSSLFSDVPSSPTLSPPSHRTNVINLTLSESRPLDETATSERSEDNSHSRTVDTVSETASCTASDLSEIPPSLKLQVNPVPDSSPPLPVTSAPTLSTPRDSSSSPDSGELPPFADTCLSQDYLTIIPPSFKDSLLYRMAISSDWENL